jgi:hypothetical protein
MKRRTLSLKSETLAEIGVAELAEVVGAQATGGGTVCVKTLLCITDEYRTTCLNCE